MKESIWGYAIMTLGILAIGIIWFFANVTRTDQHNYNLLKETVESAMYDAIDLSAYRDNGTIRIEEKIFIANFVRRFAENADLSNEYKIEIYDISEVPPKVSLRVLSKSSTTSTGEVVSFNVVNNIDAVLEAKYGNIICYPVTEEEVTKRSDGNFIGKIPDGNFKRGDEYVCEVGPNIFHHFFVLGEDDGKVSLIMASNICSDGITVPKSKLGYNGTISEIYNGSEYVEPPVELCASLEDNNYKIKQQLTAWTKNWTTVKDLGVVRLPMFGEVSGNNPYDYCLAYGYDDDLELSAEDVPSYGLAATGKCPEWLVNDLHKSTSYDTEKNYVSGLYGYWLEGQPSSNLSKGYVVSGAVGRTGGYYYWGKSTQYTHVNGIRPVIVVKENMILN